MTPAALQGRRRPSHATRASPPDLTRRSRPDSPRELHGVLTAGVPTPGPRSPQDPHEALPARVPSRPAQGPPVRAPFVARAHSHDLTRPSQPDSAHDPHRPLTPSRAPHRPHQPAIFPPHPPQPRPARPCPAPPRPRWVARRAPRGTLRGARLAEGPTRPWQRQSRCRLPEISTSLNPH